MPQHSVKSSRLFQDHILYMDLLCHVQYLIIGEAASSVRNRNILPQACLVMGKILKNHGNAPAQHTFMFFHIHPANFYLSLIRRKHAGKEADKGGFPGAVLSHHGYFFPRRYRQANVMQHLPVSTRISE